jgi:hypothetical protein
LLSCTAHVSRPHSSQQQNTRNTKTNKNNKNTLTRFSSFTLVLTFSASPSALPPSSPIPFLHCTAHVSRPHSSQQQNKRNTKTNKKIHEYTYKMQCLHTGIDLQRFPQRLASLGAYTVAPLHRTRQPPSLLATTKHAQHKNKQKQQEYTYKIQFLHTGIDLQRFPQRLASLVAYTVSPLHRTRQPPSLLATTKQAQHKNKQKDTRIHLQDPVSAHWY